MDDLHSDESMKLLEPELAKGTKEYEERYAGWSNKLLQDVDDDA